MQGLMHEVSGLVGLTRPSTDQGICHVFGMKFGEDLPTSIGLSCFEQLESKISHRIDAFCSELISFSQNCLSGGAVHFEMARAYLDLEARICIDVIGREHVRKSKEAFLEKAAKQEKTAASGNDQSNNHTAGV